MKDLTVGVWRVKGVGMGKAPKKGETSKARKPAIRDLKVLKGTGARVKGGDGTTTTPAPILTNLFKSDKTPGRS
jgi:hypothetical protein